MWLAPDGRLLASSDPTDADRLGQTLEIPDFTGIRPGEVVSRTNFSQRLQGEIAFPHALIPLTEAEFRAIQARVVKSTLSMDYLRINGQPYAILMSAGFLILSK